MGVEERREGRREAERVRRCRSSPPPAREAGEGAGGGGPAAAGAIPAPCTTAVHLPQGFLGEVRAQASGGGASRSRHSAGIRRCTKPLPGVPKRGFDRPPIP